MSADSVLLASDTELVSAVLAALRRDEGVRSQFGNPPRLFDAETVAAAFPYGVLERHETLDVSSSETRSFEHRLQFGTRSRFGGLVEAKGLLSALRGGLERMELSLSTQRVVLVFPTYSDVLRSASAQVFRGILRVRILTEEL
ncbi:MAG: DUF3168 domain-containing protein [Pseudomonadota bacterium]